MMCWGGLYGLWCAVTLVAPLNFFFTVAVPHPAHIAIAAVLIIVHIVCIPVLLKTMRQFLCSTVWAREHGITPDRLRMFTFRA